MAEWIRRHVAVCPLHGRAAVRTPTGMAEPLGAETLGAETLETANGAEAVMLVVATPEMVQIMGITVVTRNTCVLDKVARLAMVLLRTETHEVAVASEAVAVLHPVLRPVEEGTVARRLLTSGRRAASAQCCSLERRHPAPWLPRSQATSRARADEGR